MENQKTLQSRSVKIFKSRRKIFSGEFNFVCGACSCAYRSYPALYLHIKRKHNGIRPPNTKSSRVIEPLSTSRIHTGRPQKPSRDVDDIAEEQMHIERVQSELLGFLGEKLTIVTLMDSKPRLETVIQEIIKACTEINNEAVIQLRKQTEELFEELKQGYSDPDELELDFDTVGGLDKSNSLKILSWFLLWLGKYVIRIEALKDFTIIFSKIWAVIEQKKLETQDLDNKLVWNGVTKECESCLAVLNCFSNKKELIYEFVSKICHLIGKIFE